MARVYRRGADGAQTAGLAGLSTPFCKAYLKWCAFENFLLDILSSWIQKSLEETEGPESLS